MVRGFSLIELLVVTGIFVVITGVVLANNAQFNSSVLLGNAAYDIALSVRQAQVYGLSTQAFSGQFQVGYGLHFASPTEYLLFADLDEDNNKRYDAGVDQVVATYALGRGHTIKRFCGIRADLTEECSDNASALTHIDVGFLRPNPDATITGDNPSAYSIARITIQSTGGQTRTVSIQSTGQISVTNP
ncbi:MAG: prepilin-type N-terminal cleavage/methylation domain-containing protein [Candidatus Pacebacteria bacterium]|jgi:prepilin-type N-terminal cleavage/methylation domain-containing protein|nr:prepilin-type N-terminal cleavage/methylation domain-containing protein [Candidatus Paceibacterota bacterium]